MKVRLGPQTNRVGNCTATEDAARVHKLIVRHGSIEREAAAG